MSDASPAGWKPTPSAFLRLPAEGLQYLKAHGVKGSLQHINQRDAHPFVQFCKYGLCGGTALLTNTLVWYLLSATIIPGFEGMIQADGTPLDDAARERNNIINNLIGFVPANFVAYFLNVLWVFEPGRHSRIKEFSLFTGVALVSTVAGLFLGPVVLIGKLGLPSIVSQFGLAFTSAMVNYVCRKFLIFKG